MFAQIRNMQRSGSARGEAAAAAATQGQQPETCLAVFSLLRFTRLVSHLALVHTGGERYLQHPAPFFFFPFPLPFHSLSFLPPAFFNKHPDVFVYRVWKCDRLCDSACVTFIGARWRPWRHDGVWNMLASWCMSPGLLWLFSVALENRAPLLFFFFFWKIFFFFPSLSLKSSTFLLHTQSIFLSPFWCRSGGGRRRRGGSELRGRPQLPLGAGEMVVHCSQQVRGKDRTRFWTRARFKIQHAFFICFLN